MVGEESPEEAGEDEEVDEVEVEEAGGERGNGKWKPELWWEEAGEVGALWVWWGSCWYVSRSSSI